MAYDWEAIERDYRMGHKSLRTLCAEYGVKSPGTISKRAKKFGWTQDKTEEVRQKTRAALIQDAPDGNSSGNREGNTPTPEDIDRQVKTNVTVIREHRTGIRKGMALVDILSSQLKEVAETRAEIEDQIYEETEPETEDGRVDYKKRNAMLRSIALPANAGTLRDLSTAMKNFITLERQAYNMDDDGGGDGPTKIIITRKKRDFGDD